MGTVEVNALQVPKKEGHVDSRHEHTPPSQELNPVGHSSSALHPVKIEYPFPSYVGVYEQSKSALQVLLGQFEQADRAYDLLTLATPTIISFHMIRQYRRAWLRCIWCPVI